MARSAFNALPPSSMVNIATLALALQGEHGVISKLAHEYDIPRQKVYDLRTQGEEALTQTFTAQQTRPGAFTLDVCEADIARTVIAMRIQMPASIQDEVAILPIIYKTGWSYGKVHALLTQAAQRAALRLAHVNLSAIKNTALDEMFSQGKPIFGGIDLDFGYLFLLEVCPNRSGPEWAEALISLWIHQDLSPEVVTKDAGSGLASGVAEAWPDVEQRDDVFHAVYIVGKEAAYLERRAYGSITAFDESVCRLACARNPAQREERLGVQARAQMYMDESIDRYDRFEVLRQKMMTLLKLTERGSGRLRDALDVTAGLTRIGEEMERLGGKRIQKAATYLKNRADGLGVYLDTLQYRLDMKAEEVGGPAIVEAVVRAYQASLEVSQGGPFWDRKARRTELQVATHALLEATAWDPAPLLRAMQGILPILSSRHRASSAIENLNSVLRPYLVVQKHVSQGFLDLFRFYWNTRTRESGRYKGTSAHELVTGIAVPDWLTLLGYPPGSTLAA